VRRIPEYLLVLYSLSGTISIAVSQTVMGLGAAFAIVDRGRRSALRWHRVGLEGPLLAWTAALLLATVFASDPLASAVKMKKVVLMGMVLWPPAVVHRRWSLGRLYMGLLFSAGVTSLYGVLTFFLQGGPEIGARIRGFHGFYMTNSGLLLLCTFPALLFAANRSIAPSYRWGAGIAGAAILTAQFFGCLPGAWLGTAAGLAYLAVRRRRWIGAVVLLAAAAGLYVAPPVLQETAGELLDPGSPSNRERLRVWHNGWELFREDPWTGWGLHDLHNEYVRVKAPEEPAQGHMHSVPVHVAASMGVPGLLALGYLVFGLFRALRRARRATPAGSFPRSIVDGAETGLVAFLAAGLVEWNLGDSEILALLFFLVGTAIAAGQLGSRARLEEA